MIAGGVCGCRARGSAPAPLAGCGTPRPPHPLGRRHGRGVFSGAAHCRAPYPKASVFHGIVALRGLRRGFFFVFSVRLRLFFCLAGALVRLVVFRPLLCVPCPPRLGSGLLCFPSGSALVAGSGWSGLFGALFLHIFTPFLSTFGLILSTFGVFLSA